jgi:anti-anti-sigma factor
LTPNAPQPAEHLSAGALFDTIIDTAPEGFALFGPDLRYVRVNQALARINGVPAADHVGRTLAEIVPGVPEAGHLEPLRRVLATGEPVVDLEVSGFTAADPDDPRTWLVSYYPVRDASGAIQLLGSILTDITDRKRQEMRTAILAELGAILDEVVGLDERLQRLSRLVVPQLAEMASVTLLDRSGELERVAVAHVDPAEEAAIGSQPPSGETESDWTTGPALVAPMEARGRRIGHLAVGFRGPHLWSRHETALVQEIAARAAIAVDNARLFESERAARESMVRLQAVTAALSEALTPADVAAAVLREGMASAGAVMAAVWQIDETGDTLELIGHRGFEEAGRTPMARIDTHAPLPVPDAVRTQRAVWLGDPEVKTGRYPQLRQLGRGVSTDALYILPLTAAGKPVGAIALCFPDPAALDDENRSFASALAAQCAQALERARLFAAEREVAGILQRSLLPRRLPQVPGAEFAVRYLPAAGLAAGGDFYEVIRLPTGGIGLAVGDVVGRGAQAAAAMGQLRSALRAFALSGEPPAQVLTRLSGFAETVEGAMAATAAYAVLDPASGRFRYSCAGHPYPLLSNPDGTSEFLREGRSVPLGVIREPNYQDASATLEPGSILLLYTDGLVERRGEDVDASLERLRESLTAIADAPLPELLEEIVERQGGEAPLDDVALLALRLVPATAAVRRLRHAAHPEAVSTIRQEVREWLRAAQIPMALQTDLLLASGEAVANAVEHAYSDGNDGHVTVDLREDRGKIEILVVDQGRWRDGAGDPDRGRGFPLMRALVDEVTVDRSANGTTVRLRAGLTDGHGGMEVSVPSIEEPSGPGPAPAQVELEPDGTLVARLSGDIDLATATAVGDQLALLAAGGTLTVDLSAVGHLDSSGLRTLVRTARLAGGPMTVIAPPGSPSRRTIDLSGVDDVLVVRDE